MSHGPTREKADPRFKEARSMKPSVRALVWLAFSDSECVWACF